MVAMAHQTLVVVVFRLNGLSKRLQTLNLVRTQNMGVDRPHLYRSSYKYKQAAITGTAIESSNKRSNRSCMGERKRALHSTISTEEDTQRTRLFATVRVDLATSIDKKYAVSA